MLRGLPDIILADYNLPMFSGPAALQMLRAEGLDIPFIMMSGCDLGRGGGGFDARGGRRIM